MYVPEHFKENDIEEIKAIVEQFPLATCVASIGEREKGHDRRECDEDHRA